MDSWKVPFVGYATFCVYIVAGSANNDVDSYIYGMSYSPYQILAYHGETNTSVPVQTAGKVDGNKNFIVITRDKESVYSRKSEFGVVNEHSIYPGSLLLANQRFIDNNPDVLAVARAPLTYVIDLPGMTTDGHFSIDPTFANYQFSKEKALKTWFDKYSKENDIAGDFHYVSAFAYSQEYLRVIFGMEFKNTQVEASIDFSAMQKYEKLIMVQKFKQIYYTTWVHLQTKPSDLFSSSVTAAELKKKTNSSSPPVLVERVSYGRAAYVKLETSSTDKEAKAILATKASNWFINSEAEIEIKLKDLKMQVFVLGGSTETIEVINAQTFKDVHNVLVKKFSKDNSGFPIRYSANFIKDNIRTVVPMSTDYIKTTTTVYSKGVLRITHKGGFVMEWAITWKEVNYDKNGNKVSTEVSWDKNWKSLAAPFSQDIELPGNAQDINVFARVATGLAWEWWRTVIDMKGIPLIGERSITVWGTTLHPEHSISPSA
ncbi:tetanolysin-like [Macrosteles quadrilineatus]|uniref:tetanolysin-like n=1 Tax=Macrosteles quadrilineatus TaxID=74068 RepID=UPI0023E1A4CB|nr:tetanolysin-like [Macrosteles quadrilineatus]